MSFRRARRLAAAGLLVTVCLPAGTAGAQDPQRIAPSVGAGGVDLSGLTLEQASAKLQSSLKGRVGQPVVVRVAGKRFVIDPSAAKVAFDPLTTAKRAIRAVKPSTTAQAGDTAGGTAFGADVPLAIRHSRLAVRAFAATVASAVARTPHDATLTIGLKRLRLRRAKLGLALDAPALAAKVDAAFDAPLAPRLIHARTAKDATLDIGIRHLRVHRAQLGVALDPAALAAAIDAAADDPTASRLLKPRVTRTRPAVNANDLRRSNGTVITVEKATFTLRLFKHLKLSKTYQVAIGMPGHATPEGLFRIQDKQVNPVWSVPNSPWAGELGGSTVAGGIAANPLKARWMGITDGVGIHGTGEPWSVGSAASHGCLRMRVPDVIDLYPRVPVGTPVLIR